MAKLVSGDGADTELAAGATQTDYGGSATDPVVALEPPAADTPTAAASRVLDAGRRKIRAQHEMTRGSANSGRLLCAGAIPGRRARAPAGRTGRRLSERGNADIEHGALGGSYQTDGVRLAAETLIATQPLDHVFRSVICFGLPAQRELKPARPERSLNESRAKLRPANKRRIEEIAHRRELHRQSLAGPLEVMLQPVGGIGRDRQVESDIVVAKG